MNDCPKKKEKCLERQAVVHPVIKHTEKREEETGRIKMLQNQNDDAHPTVNHPLLLHPHHLPVRLEKPSLPRWMCYQEWFPLNQMGIILK